GSPIVHWWTTGWLERFLSAPKLGNLAPVRTGLTTCDNTRFTRFAWEVGFANITLPGRPKFTTEWAPTVMGGKGRAWIEPVLSVIEWGTDGLHQKVFQEYAYGTVSKHVRSPDKYFVPGIAFSMIGDAFVARAHRVPSVFGSK